MQHTTKWMMTPLAMLLGTLFSAPSFAVETSVIDSTSTPESTQNEGDTSCIVCKFSGAVYLSYDTNIYDKDDYRSVRNFSWGGDLVYSFSSDTKAYFSTGGYRALEDEVGTYATDSVLGLQYTNLYRFGDTGKIGVAGQLTMHVRLRDQMSQFIFSMRRAVLANCFDTNPGQKHGCRPVEREQ